MVWYGKYDDDDYTSPPPRTERSFGSYNYVAPPPLCTADHKDKSHSWGCPHSGRFRCTRCGFDYESETVVVGMCIVGTGNIGRLHSKGDPSKQQAPS